MGKTNKSSQPKNTKKRKFDHKGDNLDRDTLEKNKILEDDKNSSESSDEKKKSKKNKLHTSHESHQIEHKTINVTNITKKARKIVFVDDIPQEVASTSGETAVVYNKKTKRKHIPEDEEAIKDEDIDKFCDELSAEDNVQFDNWVKLLEAKLHSKNK